LDELSDYTMEEIHEEINEIHEEKMKEVLNDE
jgi:hypothetical protein